MVLRDETRQTARKPERKRPKRRNERRQKLLPTRAQSRALVARRASCGSPEAAEWPEHNAAPDAGAAARARARTAGANAVPVLGPMPRHKASSTACRGHGISSEARSGRLPNALDTRPRTGDPSTSTLGLRRAADSLPDRRSGWNEGHFARLKKRPAGGDPDAPAGRGLNKRKTESQIFSQSSSLGPMCRHDATRSNSGPHVAPS